MNTEHPYRMEICEMKRDAVGRTISEEFADSEQQVIQAALAARRAGNYAVIFAYSEMNEDYVISPTAMDEVTRLLRKNPNHGGKRPGAGLPYRKRLYLDEPTARTLRTLLMHKRTLLNNSSLTEEDIVKSLIDDAWHELDADWQKSAKLEE